MRLDSIFNIRKSRGRCQNVITLVQCNVIVAMYSNVTLPLTLVSNKLNVPFLSTLSNGIKIVTAFKCILGETMPKLSVNYVLQDPDSHRNQYPGPVTCNFSFLHHNTVTNVDQICSWSAMAFPLVTHTKLLNHLRDHPIHALVGLFEPITTCWNGSII